MVPTSNLKRKLIAKMKGSKTKEEKQKIAKKIMAMKKGKKK